MTVRHSSTHAYGQFLPSGTTPLTANANNTMDVGFADGTPSYSTLRLRTDIELYVVAGGGTTDVNLSFAYETIMAVGGQFTDKGGQTTSRTPLTDADYTPGTYELGHWVQWEYLYPEIDFIDVNIPQLVIVTWRPKDKTIDTQARRRDNTINGISVWMPWEIQDGAGLINTTDAGGNTYHLGARFAQVCWWEGRS
jgi:hypothetical protein